MTDSKLTSGQKNDNKYAVWKATMADEAYPEKLTRTETDNEKKGYNKVIENEFKNGKKSWQPQHLII